MDNNDLLLAMNTKLDNVISTQASFGERMARVETHIEAGKEWAEWRKETDTRVGKLEKYPTKIALIASLVVAGITAAWQWILHKA
jgi:hypothetical protein